MTGVKDMNYTTSVSPCLQVIRLIKLESERSPLFLNTRLKCYENINFSKTTQG